MFLESSRGDRQSERLTRFQQGVAPILIAAATIITIVFGSNSSALAAGPSTQSSSSESTSSVTTESTGYDGPAELPQVYVHSDMVDTPAPGSVISVPAGGNLQNAINNAKCGQTIQLQAGAVYKGFFTFPDKGCDDTHWIIVRTSAIGSLPAQCTRATPCYAGVGSLPGRPALKCRSTANVMARLEVTSAGSGPIVLKSGANHYRFVGLEITRTPGTYVVYNLALNQNGSTSNHIIFDRTWFHGTAQNDTQRGVMLDGMRYVGVIDSYFSDFHCVAVTGVCQDAQTWREVSAVMHPVLGRSSTISSKLPANPFVLGEELRLSLRRTSRFGAITCSNQ
jgi:hypothetical protein